MFSYADAVAAEKFADTILSSKGIPEWCERNPVTFLIWSYSFTGRRIWRQYFLRKAK